MFRLAYLKDLQIKMKKINFKNRIFGLCCSSSNSGFTIVETLVAITILMIAIAGPLTIAQKGLLASSYARDQMIASFLAQDGLEYAKNVRDNNLRNRDVIDWLYGLSSCTSHDPCSINTLDGDPTSDANVLGVDICPSGYDTSSNYECPLYKSSTDNIGYTPDSSNIDKTQFNRVFYIIPDQLNSNKASMVVKVFWYNGTVANEVTYQDEIYNIRL